MAPSMLYTSTTLLSIVVLATVTIFTPSLNYIGSRVVSAYEGWNKGSAQHIGDYHVADTSSIFLVSIDPLVVYIKDFVSKDEATHIAGMSESRFIKSGVTRGDLKAQSVVDVRDSYSALPERDAVIRSIEDRARRFQGPTISGPLESMKVVRYYENGKFSYHTDWFDEEAAKARGRNRHSSFFVYLEANCTGGGTHFPYLTLPNDTGSWCDIVECENSELEGVVFKPIQGNAIFWQNLRLDGTGHDGVLHAGLPVIEGVKTGMNIWTLTPKETDRKRTDSS